MPASEQGSPVSGAKAPRSYEDLVRQVAQRVWELWQQDVRRERERSGKGKRG
jgi:hypothetical protein